jgi:glutaredoxin
MTKREGDQGNNQNVVKRGVPQLTVPQIFAKQLHSLVSRADVNHV